MITIDRLKVQLVKRDSVLVSWAFSKSFDAKDRYEFRLLVSENETDPDSYKTIFIFKDETSFVDKRKAIRLWQTIYYKVSVLDKIDGSMWESPTAWMGSAPNLEALEIIRRMDILLSNPRHGIGVPCAIFSRKQSGIFCDCWDDAKKRVRISNCQSCFGTKYDGGFYAPTVIWVNFSPDVRLTPVVEHGESEPNDTKAMTSNHPEIYPKDILVAPTYNQVFIVNSVESSTRRGYLLHQNLNMSYLDRNHVLYNLLDKYPEARAEVMRIVDSFKGMRRQ